MMTLIIKVTKSDVNDEESIDEDVKTEKIIELKKPKFLLKNLQIF